MTSGVFLLAILATLKKSKGKNWLQTMNLLSVAKLAKLAKLASVASIAKKTSVAKKNQYCQKINLDLPVLPKAKELTG